MKPCAERHMRGLRAMLATRHSCPRRARPARSCCLAQLSPQPAENGRPGWGHLSPLLPPPSLYWDRRRGEKDVLEAGGWARLPGAGWWSAGMPVCPPPSPPALGAPKPFGEVPMGGFAPTLSPKGCGNPSLALLGLPGVSTPFMGLESARRRSGLGKVPAQPLAGESGRRPGEPPPCPPSAGRGTGGGLRRPARLLPANLFPLRLPPPSPPALLQEEIQQLKSKLEKVEKERNELRLNSDRLESRVGPRRHREGVRCHAGLLRCLPQPMILLPPPTDHRADIRADRRAKHW